MTESEWLACTSPQRMMTFLRGRVSDRKARLLACAWVRQGGWPWLVDSRSRQALLIAEQYADGQATKAQLKLARRAAANVARGDVRKWTAKKWAASAAKCVASVDIDSYLVFILSDLKRVYATESSTVQGNLQELLLRCVFGNPFHPATVKRAWITPTVTSLAAYAYENRVMPHGALDIACLSVLADALEEAGCDNVDMLNHLRGPEPHTRGCWPVDLLLNKGCKELFDGR